MSAPPEATVTTLLNANEDKPFHSEHITPLKIVGRTMLSTAPQKKRFVIQTNPVTEGHAPSSEQCMVSHVPCTFHHRHAPSRMVDLQQDRWEHPLFRCPSEPTLFLVSPCLRIMRGTYTVEDEKSRARNMLMNILLHKNILLLRALAGCWLVFLLAACESATMTGPGNSTSTVTSAPILTAPAAKLVLTFACQGDFTPSSRHENVCVQTLPGASLTIKVTYCMGS